MLSGPLYANIYHQFGRVEDVVNDCCGCCPVPQTEEEKEIAAEEQRNFVSGRISFIKDDPGRQVSWSILANGNHDSGN
jgi:hypothetical protein